MKNVKLKNEYSNIPEDVIKAAGSLESAIILYNRGYTTEKDIIQMIDDSQYNYIDFTEFEGIDKAIDLIQQHIRLGNRIAVYGDYDVDGITSTAVILDCLKNFTSNVTYHLPDRFKEGYGMNKRVISELHKENVKLIITCDCGISNVDQINIAKEKGMDVIVTDHHNLPEKLPEADVILNPKLLPDNHRAKGLSGCGMAYFLTQAIYKAYNCEDSTNKGLDLLAISIIADSVPLIGENRHLFKKAFPKLTDTDRAGLLSLFNKITSSITDETGIGMQIAPRLNAAGRLENADIALQLLMCKDVEQADIISEKIELLNSSRKSIQKQMVKQAEEQVENLRGKNDILVLYEPTWHHGVVGIVAGRIAEEYMKPTICFSAGEDGKIATGSARSVEGINIYNLLKECEEYLIRFGGHSMAAGLAVDIEKLDAFRRAINDKAVEKEIVIEKTQQVDFKFEYDMFNMDFYHKIKNLGPYGSDFEVPTFYADKIYVISDRLTKDNHHIMMVKDEKGNEFSAVKWFGGSESLEEKEIDATFTLDLNSFKGQQELQLNLDIIQKHEEINSIKYTGNIIDIRNVSDLELMSYSGNNTYFYCRTLEENQIENTSESENVKNIIFVTPPVNTKHFRECILARDIENVYINFKYKYQYSPREFLQNLMKVIKKCVREDEVANIEYISSILGIEPGIFITSVKYLKAMGTIEYKMDELEQNIFFEKGSGIADSEATFYFSKLKRALQEKEAYQKFFTNLNVKDIKKYLEE